MPRLSIPRSYDPLPGPAGERRADCDYCGLKWYRSQMRRDASGRLACPDDDDGGRDVVTLDRANAAHLAKAMQKRPRALD